MNKIDSQVLDCLIHQFPDVKTISTIQKIPELDFKLQNEKHLANGALGGAIGVICTPDNKIILVKRNGLHPGWALPGGTVEANENFLDAFDREIREEIGLVIKKTNLFLIEKKQFVSPSGKKLNFLLAVFNASIEQYVLPKQTTNAKLENLKAELFEYEQLPESMILADRDKIEYFYKQYLTSQSSHVSD